MSDLRMVELNEPAFYLLTASPLPLFYDSIAINQMRRRLKMKLSR